MAEENGNPGGTPQDTAPTEPQDTQTDPVLDDYDFDAGEDQGGEPETPARMSDEDRQHIQTWLGRKLKERDDNLLNEVRTMFQQVRQGPQPQPQNPFQPNVPFQPQVQNPWTQPEPPDPNENLEAYLEYRDRQKQQQQVMQAQQNAQAYYGQLESIKDPDPAMHNAIMAEIQHNDTGNPVADAQVNYANAKIAVLQKRLTGDDGAGNPPPPNPLQHNRPPASGLGVSQPGVPPQGGKATAYPKNLSDYSRKLIRRAGWNPQKVKEVLANE